jgi:hypothetical protein
MTHPRKPVIGRPQLWTVKAQAIYVLETNSTELRAIEETNKENVCMLDRAVP